MCASRFYATARPTFAQRFSEINAADPRQPRILSRPCQQHDHKCFEYLDTHAKARQLSLAVA